MITNNNQQTAEANLRLAVDITERRGWAVARLIAASVEVRSHGGDRRSDQVVSNDLKLGLSAAAQILRMGDKTISGYLKAWDRAAEDSLVTPAADLTPADGQSATLPDADWSEYYVTTTFPTVTNETHGEEDAPTPAPALNPSPLPIPAWDVALSEQTLADGDLHTRYGTARASYYLLDAATVAVAWPVEVDR